MKSSGHHFSPAGGGNVVKLILLLKILFSSFSQMMAFKVLVVGIDNYFFGKNPFV